VRFRGNAGSPERIAAGGLRIDVTLKGKSVSELIFFETLEKK